MQIRPLGDRAVLIELGDTIDPATHALVRAAHASLQQARIRGVTEIVPAYASIAVHYSPEAFAQSTGGPFAGVSHAITTRLAHGLEAPAPSGRLVEVPVRYGGKDGPDLDEVARITGLTSSEVAHAHAAAEYFVYMIGFTPGFPYLGGLPDRLAVPRRETPRTVVAAGSVAIGGKQTGIYPLASPGGWRIIGRTDLRLFTPDRDPPTLLQLGDRVRFVAVPGE